ncbi:MAG: SDR family oxidoreductase [Hyphomicrobiaceae bacterium]|nr:SDR family oxidoreductase [Hyphomicrobiaceae bacterium]
MIVVVTGGSRGIGAEIVRRAARAGHAVAFTYRADEAAALRLVAELERDAPAVTVLARQLDVRSSAAVDVFAKSVEDEFGHVDVVVPNAGINRNAPLIGMSDEQWRDVIDTNLSGAFFVARAFLPVMLPRRFGRFVFLSSVSRDGMTGQANYAATKAGLVGLARTVAKEYGTRGITANVVAPGIVDTDMARENAGGRFQKFWQDNAAARRNATTAEVAAAVMFLADEAASYVNGACIPVTSGLDWVP